MKRIISIIILCSFVGITFSGCRYEEGPGISFKKPEDRIQGYWLLERVFKNGEQVIKVDEPANKVSNYYAFFFDGYLAVTAYDNGTTRESPTGKWLFQNGEKNLKMDFVLMGKHYMYEARIKKLSDQELRYEYTDEEGNEWRLVLFKQSYW